MYIPFDEMPDHARVWIYQAARKMSEQEVAFVEHHATQFLQQWQAHGQDLKASFEIKYDQFLIISADEAHSQASGCSIDASVHLIQALEKELQLSFMTSGSVAFLQEEAISLVAFNELKPLIEKEAIRPDTAVFDNTVQNMGDFRDRWLVESQNTWLARYFR